MKNKKALYITQAAMIAALYVVLTVFINAFNLASGAIQVRISEALCILPVFTPAAIPGLFIGCLLANLVTGAMIWDVIFGSLATLLGAIGTYYLRKTRFAFTLPPVIANMIVIPPVLMLAYHVPDAWWFLVITVGLGEVISVCILGFILKKALWNFRYQIFRIEERA
ncbi:MAG: QueT transporter family protein [Lachnospiraceae bacterium]|jgi:uncharacterized membrane protein|nr:QueT transporter family protein [Lachnospiraceae bacterium]